jgi:hypothetical protein
MTHSFRGLTMVDACPVDHDGRACRAAGEARTTPLNDAMIDSSVKPLAIVYDVEDADLLAVRLGPLSAQLIRSSRAPTVADVELARDVLRSLFERP